MDDKLKVDQKWITPPIPTHLMADTIDEESDDDDDIDPHNHTQDPFVVSNTDLSHLIDDVNTLHSKNLVSIEVKDKVQTMRRQMPFLKLDDDERGIATYKKKDDAADCEEPSPTSTPFVKIDVPGHNDIYIRKRTAIWLLQDTERVSSDRIFRVRSKQPYTDKRKEHDSLLQTETKPVQATFIITADVCMFMNTDSYQIGRVMHFIKYGKDGKHLQVKGNYVEVTQKDIGVMCTWYTQSSSDHYILSTTTTYYPLCKYLCTLTSGCIDPGSNDDSIITKNEISLTAKCLQEIVSLLKTKSHPVVDFSKGVTEPDKKMEVSKHWVTCEKVILYQQDKNILLNGKWLTDKHINFAQLLLQKQFSHCSGFQSTIYQLQKPLLVLQDMIQIIHINTNHWAVITTIGCEHQNNAIRYYDSLYSELMDSAENIISHLIPRKPQIVVELMKSTKQVGCNDCGLFAVAIATSLANGMNPSTVVFAQDEMRSHLADCFVKLKITPFPVRRTIRIKSPVLKTATIYICPTCDKPDRGRNGYGWM